MGKMRQQTAERTTAADGLQALTQDGLGQADGRPASTRRARGTQAGRKTLIRRGLLGGGALLAFGAIGVGVLVSSGGNAASQTTADAQLGSAAVAGGVQSLGQPKMISKALASEKPSAVANKKKKAATRKSAKHLKAVKPSPSASASASASASGGTGGSGGGGAAPSPTPTSIPTSAPTGGGNTDPSGQDPATSLSGFTLDYTQEFTSGSLPSGWSEYNSVPGGESSSVAQWEPSMCSFSGGEAHFMADGIDSCGMGYYGTNQEYGAWFARMKGDSEPSNMWFSDIFLLWPSNGQWPPEIDIYEDGGRSRSNDNNSMFNTVGNACGSSPSQQCLRPYEQSNAQSGGVANDGTQWHTYGVEWTPSGVTWLIDGRVVYTAPASQTPAGAQQPALAMNMDLQSQNLEGSGTPSERETMTVDWVEEFRWNG